MKKWEKSADNLQESKILNIICAMVKSRYSGDGHPTFNSNPYNGYINPYYWVDDHPLLYGNNGRLDPGTYRKKRPEMASRTWKTMFFLDFLISGPFFSAVFIMFPHVLVW